MFPTFTSNTRQKNIKSKERFNTENDEKSFHIQKQTFYHNYFKNIKPTEFLLKENHHKNNINTTLSATSFRWHQNNSLH